MASFIITSKERSDVVPLSKTLFGRVRSTLQDEEDKVLYVDHTMLPLKGKFIRMEVGSNITTLPGPEVLKENAKNRPKYYDTMLRLIHIKKLVSINEVELLDPTPSSIPNMSSLMEAQELLLDTQQYILQYGRRYFESQVLRTYASITSIDDEKKRDPISSFAGVKKNLVRLYNTINQTDDQEEKKRLTMMAMKRYVSLVQHITNCCEDEKTGSGQEAPLCPVERAFHQAHNTQHRSKALFPESSNTDRNYTARKTSSIKRQLLIALNETTEKLRTDMANKIGIKIMQRDNMGHEKAKAHPLYEDWHADAVSGTRPKLCVNYVQPNRVDNTVAKISRVSSSAASEDIKATTTPSQHLLDISKFSSDVRSLFLRLYELAMKPNVPLTVDVVASPERGVAMPSSGLEDDQMSALSSPSLLCRPFVRSTGAVKPIKEVMVDGEEAQMEGDDGLGVVGLSGKDAKDISADTDGEAGTTNGNSNLDRKRSVDESGLQQSGREEQKKICTTMHS